MMKMKSPFSIRILRFFLCLLIGEVALGVGIYYYAYLHPIQGWMLLLVDAHGIYVIALLGYGTMRILKPYQKAMNTLSADEKQMNNAMSSLSPVFPELSNYVNQCKDILDERNIMLQNNVAEYLALQNQINPHFLYNALESIRGDMLEEGNTKIAETLEALSMFFRYSVSDTGKLVTLEAELENVEYYCMVQKYRFGDCIQMEVIYDWNQPEILEIPVPKLVLQPIVENAIFHGLEKKIGGGKITIKIEITQSRLLIHVIDDGMGMPESILAPLNSNLKNALTYGEDSISRDNHRSVALLNIAKRIQILYGVQYGLHIFSKVDYGTCVCLTMPISEKIRKKIDHV